MFCSIIIPVYRDTEALERTLGSGDFAGAETIVVSTRDDRGTLARLERDRQDIVWVEAERGRALQMNAGAAAAHGSWLLFLHADTRLPPGWADEVARASRDPSVAIGCFRFALDSDSVAARVLERGVRLRVALGRLPYGDQALFVRRDLFQAMGGYAAVPIMEDVDLVVRLRRRGRVFSSPLPAVTSARRWERDGWAWRTLLNIGLILLYFAGASPVSLRRLAHL